MARGNYSAGKRMREAEKAKKKREKRERLRQNREQRQHLDGIPIATADEIQVAAARAHAAMKQQEQESPDEALPPLVTTRNQGRRTRERRGSRGARLFVGRLSWDTTTDELRQLFETCGEVVDAVVVLDRDTGRSRGFGFVTMASQAEAKKALTELDGRELDGREIAVNVATERSRR